MISPARANILVPRHQPFALEVIVPFVDWTGQAPTFQARENPEAIDPAVINLGKGVDNGDGVYLSVVPWKDGIATRIFIQVSKVTLDAIPQALPLGSNLVLFYGYKHDGSELFGGQLTLEAQANHA
jgi:hypothetical protein